MVQRMRAEESFGELRRVDLTRAVAVLYIQYDIAMTVDGWWSVRGEILKNNVR